MCCVHKAKVFRKQNYRRFDEGQFTKVGGGARGKGRGVVTVPIFKLHQHDDGIVRLLYGTSVFC